MAAWLTEKAWNCRDTSGFITDPANTTYLIDEDTFPTVRSIGGEDVEFGYADAGFRFSIDRDDTQTKLAGAASTLSTDTDMVLQVTLDEPGVHFLRAAVGDMGSPRSLLRVEIYDNEDLLHVIAGATSDAGAFLDATGVERPSPTDWDDNNALQELEFATTTFIAKFRYLSATYVTTVAHIGISPVVVAGGGGIPVRLSAQRRFRS